MEIKIEDVIAAEAGRVAAMRESDMPAATEPGRPSAEAMREDFALWARTCVTIRHKMTGEMVPFVLNRPQRRVLAELERMRRAGRPIRLIMLKSRQWGGSTLVQLYMAWIQLMHKRNWHSLICAHVKDTATAIRGMYANMLAYYPEAYREGEEKWEFKPFERSANTRVLPGRGCRVTLASAENQDSARGNDFAMVHLSEVAFWKRTPQHTPADLVRAVCSGVPLVALSMIVLESTANGVGNYFHNEWLKAEAGRSAFTPVFVPWYEYGLYTMEVDDAAAAWEALDDYERGLWRDCGLSLGQVWWYHNKRLEFPDHASMMAEYPSTAREAFISTGRGVFDSSVVERLRAGCVEPELRGDVAASGSAGLAAMRGVRLTEDPRGGLKVWARPAEGARYMAVVDVGGRSATSDWSVIAVLRYPDGSADKPEVVAQWRGHIDHDRLAWKAGSIATLYNRALLVVESNTYETDYDEGDGAYVLSRLNEVYPAMYSRRVPDTRMPRMMQRIGFHTNRSTKMQIIDHLIAMVRDTAWVERDAEALNELNTYEQRDNGSYGAREGCHDDILMTRAIGLLVMAEQPRRPLVTVPKMPWF